MRLLSLTLCWAAGIVTAAALPAISLRFWLGIAIVGLLLTLVWRRQPTARWSALLLVMFALGAARLALAPADADLLRFVNQGGLTVEGLVIAPPRMRDTTLQVDVAVDAVLRNDARIATSGRVRAQVAPSTPVRYGDRVQVTGLLVLPGESDTFSYAGYLARHGIFSQLVQASIRVLSSGHASPAQRFLVDVRELAAERIASGLPEPYASLLTGILLGDESRVAPEVADAFAATGAAHILAISGFNMVIISQAANATLRQLRLDRRLSAALAIGFIAVYTVFVGANPAVVRAAIMSSLLITGSLLRRRTYVPASLAFAALVMSIADPFVLWDVGFQLSLGATFGLALFATPLSQWIDTQAARLLPRPLATGTATLITPSLATSLAAQVLAAPLAAYYFGRLSLVLLPVNLLVLPVQTAVLLLGGGATLIALVAPALGQALYWLALPPLAWTTGVVRLFAHLPIASIDLAIAPEWMTTYAATLLVAAMAHATSPGWLSQLASRLNRQRLLPALAGVYALLLALAAGIVLSRPDGRLHVWFLDQGHSNAVLI